MAYDSFQPRRYHDSRIVESDWHPQDAAADLRTTQPRSSLDDGANEGRGLRRLKTTDGKQISNRAQIPMSLTRRSMRDFVGANTEPLRRTVSNAGRQKSRRQDVTAQLAVDSPFSCRATSRLPALRPRIKAMIAWFEEHGWPRTAEIGPEFADKLRSRNYAGLKIHYHNMPDETHMSVPPAVILRGLSARAPQIRRRISRVDLAKVMVGFAFNEFQSLHVGQKRDESRNAVGTAQ